VEHELAGSSFLAREELLAVALDAGLRAVPLVAGGDALLGVLLAQPVEP